MLCLKELRERKGITQSEFSRDMGVAASTVGMWEQGRRAPDSETLIKIANYFGVSVDYLIGNPHLPGGTNNPAHPWHGRVDSLPPGSGADEPGYAASYYHDPEVAAMVEDLRTRPGLRILFDASRDLTKEDIEFVLQMVKRMKQEHD